MARKPSQFDLLVARGLIKTNRLDRSTTVNQTAQNILVVDNKKGENLTTEIQGLSGNSIVKYTHSTETLNVTNLTTASFELSEFTTSTNPAFTINNNHANLNGLSKNIIQAQAKKIFIKNMVGDSILYEQQLVNSLGLGRDDIIKFLNNSRNISSNSIIDSEDYLNYEKTAQLFYDTLAGKIQYKNSNSDASLSLEQQNLEAVLKLLDDDIIEGKHLYIYLMAMKDINLKNEPEQYKNAKGEIVTGQIEKGGKTVMEYVAIHNLKVALSQMKNSMLKPKLIPVRAAGGELKASYQTRLENKKNPIEIKQELDEIMKEIITENPDVTNVRLAQKLYASSGSKEVKDTLHVADLIYEVEDLGSRFIDIKMHKGAGTNSKSRYKVSSPLKTTVEDIYNKSLLEKTDKDNFIKQLEIILSYLYYRVLNNGNIKDYDEANDTILKALITDAIMSSKVFFEYYRHYSGSEFKQADFLLTLQGYVWYSDFFYVFAQDLFEGTGGTKASIKLKAPTISETIINNNDNNNKKVLNKMINILESDKDITSKNIEIFKKFTNSFISSPHIQWTIDIDKIYEKVQKNLQKYAKK